MKFTFTPNIKTIGELDLPVRDIHEIKNEPMIYSGTPDFAHHKGGPLTKEILRRIMRDEMYLAVQALGPDDFHTVVDTRVTMTMPGMYPSIPGWHCDDVPRGKTHNQPVLHGINPFVQHFMVLVSDQEAAVSCTEFVTEPFEVDVDLANVWNSVDRAVEAEKPKTRFLKQGEIIRFNQEAIHRASMTKTAGWRFFIRVSYTHREPANEHRNQVQVYVSNNGW
jgi:hypothetical protein